MKRTPLARRTPLQRRSPLRSRGHRIPRGIRQEVLDRANGRCEARIREVCTIRAEHVHHLRPRSQGGKDDPAILVALCASCHGHVHRNPAWSYEHGWLWRAAA